jgi:hypothetical protein
MTAEEERWIAIILEESRKADEAGRAPAPRSRKCESSARPQRSGRDGETFGVRAEHFIKRPRHHSASVI